MNNEPTPTVKATIDITKGSVVKYKDGYVRVTAKFKNTVNLGGIFR